MCNSLKRWLSYDLVTLYHSSLYVYLDMRTYFDKGHTSYSTCKRILTPTHPKFRYKSVIEISKLMNFEPFWWLTLGMCTTFSARGDFRAQLVKTLVLPSPTCCDRSVFSLLIWGIFHRFFWIDWPEVLKFNRLFLKLKQFRATSHTRLRARDHCTSGTLIGGKGGAVPSSLHTYAWGTNGVCECKVDVKSTWMPTWHRMDHVSWSLGP